MINLWEIRNNEVHGSTDSKRQWIMKQWQITEFKKLMMLKKDVRPSDLSFFPDDEEGFIEESTVQQLWDYVAMHQKTFINSKKQWKNQSLWGVQSITGWLRIIASNALQIRRTEQ